MPPKTPEARPGKAVQPPAAVASARKPWKKKTPVEVVLEQADKLKGEIADLEQEIQLKRKQLQKFEEARKIFETS